MNQPTATAQKSPVNLHDYRRAFQYKDLKTLRLTLFVFRLLQLNWLVRSMSRLTGQALRFRLPVSALIRRTIYPVFCAGETVGEALTTIDRLQKYQVHPVLDYVSEGESTTEAFERNSRIIAENIRMLGKTHPAWSTAVSVKLTGLENPSFLENINATGPEEMTVHDRRRYDAFVTRLDAICQTAAQFRVVVYIDAEDRCMQDLFDRVVEMMMARYNGQQAVVYNTVQMYLRDRLDYLQRVIGESAAMGYRPGLKLVRGAYVEKERAAARAKGEESPVHASKQATDAAFDAGLRLCLSHAERVYTCVATHNERSVLLALQLIEEFRIGDHVSKVKFSQLYGMSDHLTFNLAARGFNASKYLPYGEVNKAIPYLIRRAEENSSISGQMPQELVYLKRELERRKRQMKTVFSGLA